MRHTRTYPRNLTCFFAPRPRAPFCALCPSLERFTPTRTPLHHTPHSRQNYQRPCPRVLEQLPARASNTKQRRQHLTLLLSFSRLRPSVKSTHTQHSPLKMLHQGLRRAAHVVLTTQTATPVLAARTYTSTAFLSRPFSSQGANLQKVFEGGREGLPTHKERDIVPNFFTFLANGCLVVDALGPAAKN